ncbi:hypothetical protein Tco_0585539 [Tanacetum coccineum]
MYIMTSRPRTRVSVQAPFEGVTNWYQSQVIENQVMAAPIISISSDSSEESVPIAPADLIVAPVVGAGSVISPTEVLDLVDYSSSSDSDPSEDSFPIAASSMFPLAPVVAPLGIRRRPAILV